MAWGSSVSPGDASTPPPPQHRPEELWALARSIKQSPRVVVGTEEGKRRSPETGSLHPSSRECDKSTRGLRPGSLGVPSPTLSSRPAEGLLPLEPNTSPTGPHRPQITAAALAFPHPQSHGPRPAHLQRTASLFHFCKVGVGATGRMAEGLPVPRFREVPGSSLPHPLQLLHRETQGMILGSPAALPPGAG